MVFHGIGVSCPLNCSGNQSGILCKNFFFFGFDCVTPKTNGSFPSAERFGFETFVRPRPAALFPEEAPPPERLSDDRLRLSPDDFFPPLAPCFAPLVDGRDPRGLRFDFGSVSNSSNSPKTDCHSMTAFWFPFIFLSWNKTFKWVLFEGNCSTCCIKLLY